MCIRDSRYTAKYLARSMNLTGWVKNEYDGTVVMEVQGREAMIFDCLLYTSKEGEVVKRDMGVMSKEEVEGLIG